MADGFTPMFIACQNGQLSVCKWLLEVGAAADITKTGINGLTPLRIACSKDHTFICRLLILNGALSDPDADTDNVDRDIVIRDVQPGKRPALLAWALEAVAASNSFRNTIVMGTFHPEGTASTTDLLRRTLLAGGSSAAQADLSLIHI